ncbi:MAG: endo-1,3-alpha-glucanase family glycosylhydrolase [Thermoproteota archaeon]
MKKGQKLKKFWFLILASSLIVILGVTFLILEHFLRTREVKTQELNIDISKIPKLVMAFYHDWYGTPSGPTGQWVHWNHPIWNTTAGGTVIRVHDPNVLVKSNRRDIGAVDYPLFGPYDCRDENLIKWQIKLAREAGIDAFVIDWWGDTSGQELTDKNMKVMIDVNEKYNLGMKFLILFDGLWGSSSPPPIDVTISRLEYAIGNYGNRPSYFKIQDIPVVFVYSAVMYSPKEWTLIIKRVRSDGFNALFFGDAISTDYVNIFDGFQLYSPVAWLAEGQNISRIYEKYSILSKKFRKVLALPVLPGYNDTAVRWPGMVVPRRDGETYNETWKAVISSGAQWALVCSWNEWHEGTEIEPSREYGYRYTNLTLFWTTKFKSVGATSQRLSKVWLEKQPSIEEVYTTLGEENKGLGLLQVEWEDGKTEPVKVAGMWARKPVKTKFGGMYMYFDIDDNFLFACPNGTEVNVTITFYDNAIGPLFRLDYDSNDLSATLMGTYKATEYVVGRKTNTWRNYTFCLSNVYFADRENGNTDFRIAFLTENVYISKVVVTKFSRKG